MKSILFEIINWPVKVIFLIKLAKLLRDDPEKAARYADYYEKYMAPPLKPFNLDIRDDI